MELKVSIGFPYYEGFDLLKLRRWRVRCCMTRSIHVESSPFLVALKMATCALCPDHRISGGMTHHSDHFQGSFHASSDSWYTTTAIQVAVSSVPANSRSTRTPQVPSGGVELLARLIPSSCRLDSTYGGYTCAVKCKILSFFLIHSMEIGSLRAAMRTVRGTDHASRSMSSILDR